MPSSLVMVAVPGILEMTGQMWTLSNGGQNESGNECKKLHNFSFSHFNEVFFIILKLHKIQSQHFF